MKLKPIKQLEEEIKKADTEFDVFDSREPIRLMEKELYIRKYILEVMESNYANPNRWDYLRKEIRGD